MTPSGGIQELIHVLPPKTSHYPTRLTALDRAIELYPDEENLYFLKVIVDAQAALFESMESATFTFNSDAPFLQNPAVLFPQFKALVHQMVGFFEENVTPLPEQLERIFMELKDLSDNSLKEMFEALLTLNIEEIPAEFRLFLSASLQVLLHKAATELNVDKEYLLTEREVCPCCQMPATVSVIDNEDGGLRYLYCSFCETKWHFVRSQCTECVSNKNLFQTGVEEEDFLMTAEVCDECKTYLKYLDRTENSEADPFIEGFLALPLDLALAEAGYKTYGINPYLL